MSDRTVTIREIGGSCGVILPKALLEHLGSKKGERLAYAEVPGGVMFFSDDSREGSIVADALDFMDRHDAAFRELKHR